MDVDIAYKPENECKIQSGVMISMKRVKTTKEERTYNQEREDGLLHGTQVLKYLIYPWDFSHRMVGADSYCASVGAAIELMQQGLRFIGLVKTITKIYDISCKKEEIERINSKR
jgi:Transposase IS4